MPMSRLMTIVEYEVKPEHRNALIEIAKGHAARSRAQDGCQQFDVLLATEDANRILLVEAWRDEAALDAHRHSAMMAQAPGTHQDWVVSRKVTRCTAD
jgi:(4S)-4-hydroxy-5-phosphonooxypentane-2,3-dione isomerase